MNVSWTIDLKLKILLLDHCGHLIGAVKDKLSKIYMQNIDYSISSRTVLGGRSKLCEQPGNKNILNVCPRVIESTNKSRKLTSVLTTAEQ